MIFNLFSSREEERPADVKGVRHALLLFIKQELQKAEGGEGNNIKGLCVYINCGAAGRHVYEAAVYADEPEKFKAEIQKIADDYALELPANWTFDLTFDEEIPAEAVRAPLVDAALFVKTSKHFIKQSAAAYLRALSGKTVQELYTITSESGKVNIGRDQKAQSDEGFFRINHIAFPSDSDDESNRYISRQHAHIEWNQETGRFMLYADDGGVPPRNKIKIRSEVTENLVKLHSTHIGHELQQGDQVVLGESAVLEFSYRPFTNE